MWKSERSPFDARTDIFPLLDLIRFDYPILPKSFHSVSVPIKLITMLTHSAIFFSLHKQNYSRLWCNNMEKQNTPLFKPKQARKAVREARGPPPSAARWWHGNLPVDRDSGIVADEHSNTARPVYKAHSQVQTVALL